MKWTQLTIKTNVSAEDIIISEMYDLGLMGAQIEDHVPLTAWEKEQMFVDILPDEQSDDERALLHFFVEVVADDTTVTDSAVSDAANTDPATVDVSGSSDPSALAGFSVNGLSATQDNSYSYVSGDNAVSDLPALIAAMQEKLEEIRSYMDIGEGTIEISETEDADWANKWKEFFKPFYIEDLLVAPSWLSAEEIASFMGNAESPILRIDPGSAFGTGMHETTQLCIKAIKEYVSGDSMILDVGTGSGILGIIGLLYGAKGVVGTDLDICAIDAVAENLEQNSLSKEQFSLLIGNLITDEKARNDSLSQGSSIAVGNPGSAKEQGSDQAVPFEGFDIVTANILAEVLVNLTPVVPSMLKKGGVYITSGILEGKEELVKKACEAAGMKVLDIRAQGEWRCVIATL
ncbi:MAG: 50S ribosomal protein L11 methyltransferase [Lachnospiraceae bacterium]|nr:50S ribosomal protein L11 methyltransferase [Lachnospiraceae bacterium]